jgi:hypothetical protein
VKRSLIVFLIYLALAVALTYPLITMLGIALPSDPGDPALNTWILWWNAHTIPYTAKWWNAPAFYPGPGSLAFSENLLGLSVISSPVQWLGGGPQLAYNIVLLLTFPLCAIGAYQLARELTGREDAAFVAGLLFGFAPYRIAHLPQIQCLAAFAMPWSLLALHRYLRDPRSRWLALFGAGWFMQSICNGYYMLFFGVVVCLWILWFARDWRTFLAIVTAWVVASLPLAPLLWDYRSIHEGFAFTRDFGTIRDFGADVAALLNTTSTLRVWGWLHAYRRAEGELFPGLTITALIVAGAFGARQGDEGVGRGAGGGTRAEGLIRLVRRLVTVAAVVTAAIALSAVVSGPWRFRVLGFQVFSVGNPIKPLTYSLALGIGLALTAPSLRRSFASRSSLGFYGLAALLTWLFSLGPAPTLMGEPLMYRGPYALLMFLPGFNALRVPARFWMMTTLCLAVIGGMLFDHLASRFGATMRLLAACAVSFCVLADGWVTDFPLVRTPAPWNVENCAATAGPKGSALGDDALMELPLGRSFDDAAAMYRSMFHGHPVVNGYSGYFPPHYAALRFGLDLRDDDLLTQLAAHGAQNVVIDTAADQDGSWRRYVTSHAGVQTVCAEGGRTLYRLPPAAESNRSPAGAPLHIGSIWASVNNNDVKYMLDGDRTTRWESGPQTDRTEMNIDLGDTKSVTAVQLMLGPFVEDFPRALSIEALGKGAVWQELYRGGTAGLAFVGALQSPKDVPLTFEFAPVQTRYLRLRLLANDEKYYWSVAELKVLGS